ncbi:MAG: hypothetical protein JW873_06400 [Candidatus Saganbacteria bacterium]|nr:hypothetical protein [Candidatus Saganbacteria bacterium]
MSGVNLINPLSFAGAPPAPAQPVNTEEVNCFGLKAPLKGSYSGVFVEDNAGGEKSRAFEREVGKTDIVLKFLNLEGGWVFPGIETGRLNQDDRAIFIKLEPHIPGCKNDPVPYLDKVINGDYDALLIKFAEEAKRSGRPIFLSFGHEMNGHSPDKGFFYSWAGDPAKYIKAWRRVHDVIKRAGAANVKFVWNPHVMRPGKDMDKDFTPYYPGNDQVDIIAFDVYGGQMDELLTNAMAHMDKFLGRPYQNYAIGEWGAKNGQENEFKKVLRLARTDPRLKFEIYFNAEGNSGNFVMSPEMKHLYRQYLIERAGDKYDLSPRGQDVKKNKCLLPIVPDPWQVLRPIDPSEVLAADKLLQQYCPADEIKFQPVCLPQITPGWDPVFGNQPSRSLTRGELYPAERSNLDDFWGHVYDYGSHVYLLSAAKIMTGLDIQRIGPALLKKSILSELEKHSAPFDPHTISPESFRVLHPEFAEIRKQAPGFATYLEQPAYFWENIVIMLSAYTQKAIERNDEKEIAEAIRLGKRFHARLDNWLDYEKANATTQTFIPFNYRKAVLALTLAEAYSQTRDPQYASYSEKAAFYRQGLAYVKEALEKFRALSDLSPPDYFSLTKAALIAADLHTKLGQLHLRYNSEKMPTEKEARAEYDSAKALYDGVAALDYKNGTGLNVKVEGIEIKAPAAEIARALTRNEELYYLNHDEAVASAQGIFRFLRGSALIKQASFYLEYPFKPFDQQGYKDIVQQMVLVKAGLAEIEAGSPFADLRYFRALGNLLMAKLAVTFADSLAYSTSEIKDDKKARLLAGRGVAYLKKHLPGLLPPAEWAELLAIVKKDNSADPDAVRKDYAHITGLMKDATPDFLADAKRLLAQTHTTFNYRLEFAGKMVALSQSFLDQAKKTMNDRNSKWRDLCEEKPAVTAELRRQDAVLEQRPDCKNKPDPLKKNTPALYAELLLQEVALDLRRSAVVAFKNGNSYLENNKIEYNPKVRKTILDKIAAAEALLPETSYLKIEAASARATLELSEKLPAGNRALLFRLIGHLTKNTPLQPGDEKDQTFGTIALLDKQLLKRIEAQPEPNRTMLLIQFNTKLALAYIILGARLEKTVQGGMTHLIASKDKETIGRINAAMGRAKELLLSLDKRIGRKIETKAEPLLFDLHDIRAEVYHLLAITYAVGGDQPLMQHYLTLARRENISSNSRFNVLFRSWGLNKFVLRRSRNSGKRSGGTSSIGDGLGL